jgi:putative transposase
MRKEPFCVGDFVHVYNRGNRKMDIVNDINDRWRFVNILRYFNDEASSVNKLRNISFLLKSNFNRYDWPKEWKAQRPIVKILAYCLMPNHFHLLLKEIKEGGITAFMRRVGVGYTNYKNTKENNVGKIFQGSYKARTIKDEVHLQYVDAYIQVFNPFELIDGADLRNDFGKSFNMATDYDFCSLAESFGKKKRLIVDRDILDDKFKTIENYKKFAFDAFSRGGIAKFLREASID